MKVASASHPLSGGLLARPVGRPEAGATNKLAGQFAQELALVHVVFESLVAVDEDDRDFVGESAAQFVVAFDVNFPPGKAPAPVQLSQRFLDDLAQVTALAGINDDLARLRHGRSLARGKALGN